jgi:signal transduction histidine kinase
LNPGPRHAPLPAAAAPLGSNAFVPSLPVLLAMAVALSAVVAALLMLAEPRAAFAPILVTSECIGLLILGWNMVFARLLTRWRLAPERAIGLSMIAATPLGYITGHGLARWLLGRPMDLFPAGRNHALDLLVTLLAGCFVAYLFWTAHRLARERAARAEAQRLAVEAQLRLLRAQLEPHMMFNTLATLRSLVEVDPARAQHMIDRLITYLRAALAASRAETTTLAQEFEQLRAYLDIMALRMGARLEFTLELPAALQMTPIPPMLLQPLVENAIRHGLEPQVGPGSLKVQALRQGAGVEISVADSGLGLSQADAAEPARGGYGLHHVRERLAAIYGAQASLTLEPVAPHGVRATVRIPA